MTGMLQAIYDEARQGSWQDTNPSKCGCRGRGWYLSDLDTWHKCSIHGHDAPCPEDETEDTFDWRAHFRRNNANAFRTFRAAARAEGWKGGDAQFILACKGILSDKGFRGIPEPSDWINAAEALVEKAYQDKVTREELAAVQRAEQEEAAYWDREHAAWMDRQA